jgi:hypothetical protein
VVDQPALPLQEGMNPPIAITDSDGGNLLDPFPQGGLLSLARVVVEGGAGGRLESELPAAHSPGSRGAETPPSPAVAQALELFSDDLLEHLFVQGEIRHQPAQPGVLLLQLPELPNLGRHQPPELLLPG